MKKHKKYTPRAATIPMMVIRHTIPDIECVERVALNAFYMGTADEDHYDNLADCHDLLALTGHPEAKAVCDIGWIAMMNIKDRREKTGKMGATGDELQTLAAMVDFSQDFWARKSGTVFADAWRKLQAARAEQRAA